MNESVLLADIGGTYARFSLMHGTTRTAPMHFATRDFPTAATAIRHFLQSEPTISPPTRAVIAAAGPVISGRIEMPNAAWNLDAEILMQGLHFDQIELINDFAAQAWAVPSFTPADLRQIGGGAANLSEPQVILGAGTGFGLAIRCVDAGHETIIVTEGGHATLTAHNTAESQMLEKLRQYHAHISIERVLSGPGLVTLYQQLACDSGVTETARVAPEIAARGMRGECEICAAALTMFCGWLGSVIGNITLTTGARGGIYISGGVVPHFVDFLTASAFRERFEQKGRMGKYLHAIPIFVVLNHDPAFLGLARFAENKARGFAP